MADNVEVPPRIQAHVHRHDGEKGVAAASDVGHGDGLPFQVANRAHRGSPEQLDTAGVQAGQQDDRVFLVHLDDERSTEVGDEVDLTSG